MLVAIVAVVIGVVGNMNLNSMRRADLELSGGDTVPMHLSVTFQKLRVALRDFLAAKTPEAKTKFENQVGKLSDDIDQTVRSYDLATLSPEQRSFFAQFLEARHNYDHFKEQILSAGNAGRPDEGWEILWSDAYAKVAKVVLGSVDEIATTEVAHAKSAIQTNAAVAAHSEEVMWITLLLGVAMALGFGMWLTSSITRPVAQVVKVLEAVAVGDLTHQLSIHQEDEIGHMAETLNHTVEKLSGLLQNLGHSAETLSTSSQSLKTTSDNMNDHARTTATQVDLAASTANHVTDSLQTVANATEEMSSSIKEIAANAQQAAQVASSAVHAAESANTTMAKLSQSSSEIGEVVKVITSIAQQTNLLALNATIEAARAGEAGKGFAVVANEVKELAKETARATEDIGRKIGTIQDDTRAAIEAIGQIGGVIGRVNDIASTIASAVEQQNATTNEITRNVAEAAGGGSKVAENIRGVAQAAQDTSRGAKEARGAAVELSRMAAAMEDTLAAFKYERSANLAPPA